MAEATATGSQRRIARWFEYRTPVWDDVASRLKLIDRGRKAPPEAVLALIRSYPEIARDLAIARREAPQGTLTQRLGRLYLHLHRVIFRPPSSFWHEFRELFLHGAAREVRHLRWQILWVTTLFVLATMAGWWLVSSYPALAALFASEAMIELVSQGQLWTDNLHNVVPSSVLSVQLFTNNVTVSLFAVCLGVLYGLGTIYIISLNGLMLGSIFAFTAQYGMAGRLFEWVAAHGFVELSVICLAGAVGASLGESLARPGSLSRKAAFQQASVRGMRLMAVALLFLIGAGFVEGYVSPLPDLGLDGRLIVGLGYWLLFALVMSGGLGRLVDRWRRREA